MLQHHHVLQQYNQLITKMTESKIVKIKIISHIGPDEWEGSGAEALEKIMEETSNGRWVFVNSEFVAPEALTQETIEEAKDITLTNSLYGG